MKTFRAVALTTLAAMAVIAAVQVDTASATTLCKVLENPCPKVDRYPEAETYPASLLETTSATFKALRENMLYFEGVCFGSKLEWKTEKNNGPGKFLIGKISELSFSKCEEPSDCTVAKALNLPWDAELKQLPGEEGSGTMYLSSSGKGKPGFRVENCEPAGVNCSYEAVGEAFVGVVGATIPLLEVSLLFPYAGGNFFCADDLLVNATYVIGSEGPLFVDPEP